MPGRPERDAAWWREYRKKRNAQTRPVSHGKKRKPSVPTFLAWDGEGISDDDGGHRYVMLANSNGDVLEAPSIDTQSAFDFLIDHTPAHATAIVFGGSYDATMMLRSLPRETIARIMADETEYGCRVAIGNRIYNVQYRQRKFLRVQRFRMKMTDPGFDVGGDRIAVKYSLPFGTRDPVTKKWSPDYDGSILLWDVLGFFQTTFVDALSKYAIAAPIAEITKMKAKRSTFTDRETRRMRAYCIAECEALVALYTELWRAFTRAGIRPRRHDGAGAVAGELLRMQGVKEHIKPEPDHLAVPIATAYFGGRIELCKLGRAAGTVFAADLASAYPAAAQDLPTLFGEWKKAKSVRGFSISRVRWNLPANEPWYPLPYRRPNGTILFPASGEGWYWRPEVESAIAWARKCGGEIDVLETWALTPSIDVRPFSFIPELYEKRQAMIDAGDGAEKALKTALASLYGKTAQQLGATPERRPPYFALSWAGWITSMTRARLARAGLRARHDVIAFATDAVYTTSRLRMKYNRGVKLLGGWDRSQYDDGVFVQAGVYWLRKQLAEPKWEAKYRGFDRDAMESPRDVLAAWREGMAAIAVPCTRFVTYGSALASKKTWEHRGTWRTIDRKLELTGNSPKRYPFGPIASDEATALQAQDAIAGARYRDALAQYGGKIIGAGYDQLAPHLRKRRGRYNLDLIADAAGCSEDDVLDYFITHPYRLKRADAIAAAEESSRRRRLRVACPADELLPLAVRSNDRYNAFGTLSTPFDSFTLEVELLDGASEEVVIAEAEESGLA